HGEVRAVAEQDVPGMEVAVRAREPAVPGTEPPAPRDRRALDGLARGRREQRERMRVAVEDPHETLTVTDQLADPPLVERRLVALRRVHLREEAGQRLGAGVVELR